MEHRERNEEQGQGLERAADMEVGAEPVPDLRRAPTGGPAFGATQEPEFETADLEVPPADPPRRGATFGATTQDDPFPPALFPYPVEGEEGQLTLVAVFEDIEGAHHCARDLERRGIEVGIVTRRGDGPEQGIRPGNVITGPGYGLSAENESPPKDRPMGAGVAVGATLGATSGLFAATYLFPPIGTIFATGSLVTTLIGAGLGSFVGGLFEYGVTEHGDDATMYAGQVRRGGAILLARVDEEQADEARRLIGIWNPLEIRVQ
ncbi:MAG: hypothetical protein ACOY94_21840 [Bacillota bacterium]